jgi:predicted lipoprotein with Yx(FWY)xxD motif
MSVAVYCSVHPKVILLKNSTLLVILLAAALVLAAGCTQQAAVQPAPAPQPVLTAAPVPSAPLPDTVKISASSFGNILVNAQGRTLYFYANDVLGSGVSTCTDYCAATWPAFAAGAIQVSPPLNAADFGSMTRVDGSKQTTYKGRPLYTYSNDLKPGDVNGSGIDKLWNLANIPGTVITTPPTTIPTATHTPGLAGSGGGGGGGY